MVKKSLKQATYEQPCCEAISLAAESSEMLMASNSKEGSLEEGDYEVEGW